MKRNAIIATLLAVSVLGLVVTVVLNLPAPLPGANVAAEIIEPGTGKRVPLMWDEVFSKYKPRQSPGNGAWIVNYPPGTDQWAFVVNAGAADPGAALRVKGAGDAGSGAETKP